MSTEPQNLDIPLDRVPAIVCRHCGKRVSTGVWPLLSTVPCPYCAKPLTVSGQLGPLLVNSIVARGAVAWVFRAVEPTIHQAVVVQVCKPDPDDPEVLKKFVAQARSLAKSRHPNLARVLSLGHTHQLTYLIIGAVEGDSLRTLIEAKQMLTEQQALGLAIDVAQGLREAAALGATHGDLQADNIVIQPSGVAVVMNFGLDLLGAKFTAAGKVWGSPLYIAPEKLRGQTAGIQSDMYSLGCLLYHVLTTQPPFQGPSSREIAIARVRAPAPDIRLARPDLSHPTAAIIATLLHRKPADRYATYDELIAALTEAAQNTPYALEGDEAPAFALGGGASGDGPDGDAQDMAAIAALPRTQVRGLRRQHAGRGTLIAVVIVVLAMVIMLALIVQNYQSHLPGMHTTSSSPTSPYFGAPKPKPAPIPIPVRTPKPAAPVTPAEPTAAPQDPPAP